MEAFKHALECHVKAYDDAGAAEQETFVNTLGGADSSPDVVLEEIGRQVVIAELMEEVTSSVVAPDEAAVRAAYEERRSRLVTPEAREINNIVTASPQDAHAARQRLLRGEPFALVARELSTDLSTLSAGGSLGRVTRDQLDPEYAAVAFTARPHTVFGPAQTRFGWNVGMVTAIVPPAVPPYAAVQRQLAATLLAEARCAAWRDWLKDELTGADTRYAAWRHWLEDELVSADARYAAWRHWLEDELAGADARYAADHEADAPLAPADGRPMSGRPPSGTNERCQP